MSAAARKNANVETIPAEAKISKTVLQRVRGVFSNIVSAIERDMARGAEIDRRIMEEKIRAHELTYYRGRFYF